jgi:hypothetical protein
MTLAELVKTVLDVAVANYPTYGIKPPVKITGYDRKDTKKPSKGIDLIDIPGGEDANYTTNGVRMPGNQYCDMIINETTFDRVANLYNDIETLLQASSYDLTLSVIDLNNKLKTFERKYRIRYFGGKV